MLRRDDLWHASYCTMQAAHTTHTNSDAVANAAGLINLRSVWHEGVTAP